MAERMIMALRGKVGKKAERETIPGAKKLAQKGTRFTPEKQVWAILVGLSLVISLLLYPSVLTSPKTYNLGDVTDRDIRASREFLVENQALTEKNTEEAVKGVLPLYDFDPTASNVVARVGEAFALGREYLASQKTWDTRPEEEDTFKRQISEILDIAPGDEALDTLMAAGFPIEAEKAINLLVSEALKEGVVSNKGMLVSQTGKGIVLQNIQTQEETTVTDMGRFYDQESAKDFMSERSKVLNQSLKSPQLAQATHRMASLLIRPNVTFNKRETELRKDLARKKVRPFYSKVKKGEILVREGERIHAEHLLKLEEHSKSMDHASMIWRAPAMAVIIVLLLASMHMVGLLSRKSPKAEPREVLFEAVTLFVIFLVALASNFVAEEVAANYQFFSSRALLFAAPVASGAMLVSIFQGIRVAASFSLIVSVLTAVVIGGHVEFFVYFFVSSLVAGYGVRNCRERGVFIKSGLKVSLANLILGLSIEALYGSLYSLHTVIACTAAFAGGILVAVIAAGILPLIEMGFGFTTDIKLLESASLDQPLLRELMVQAPGTYHHSVIVSNMVEATAEAIHANPLLAKVAAYYHDIGKMKKPLYFIENQMGGQNRHEKLAPSMSSLILTSHVKDGVELAKRNKLGREIIDIIQQHHGTSLITYFYEKAKEQAEKKGRKLNDIKEEAFRYVGPRPQTKEAGLVMLADAVEAATKTLVDPTPARIQGMVQKIINKVFFDGQLDECELTLKDLHEIAKSFNKTLSGIFHQRIEYPEPSVKALSSSGAYHREGKAENGVTREASADGRSGNPSKKETNGDSHQVSEKNSWPRKPEDKTEAKDNLRRLGLS